MALRMSFLSCFQSVHYLPFLICFLFWFLLRCAYFSDFVSLNCVWSLEGVYCLSLRSPEKLIFKYYVVVKI